MKKICLSISLLVGVLVSGCQTTRTSNALAVDTTGKLEHRPSKVCFPEFLGSFERGIPQYYTASGDNISVGYNLRSLTQQITVTSYVYPAPKLISIGSPAETILLARSTLFKQAADNEIAGILHFHPSGVLQEKQPFENLIGTKEIPGVHAIFTYEASSGGKKDPVISELYLFQKDDWLIKYRITYLRNSADIARERIKLLIEDHSKAQQSATN